MPLTLAQEKALVFRITHRDNVAWILDNGMHARNGDTLCPNYRNIGNVELIDKRAGRVVELQPGGTLSDYVPFYFTPYSIMMLNIVTGRNVKKVPKEDIVIFVSSLPRIEASGVRFVFTNQHALALNAEYFTDLAYLDRIDWPLLQSRDFKHDPDDPEKKERYQAEALIWKHVPLAALRGVCCYTAVVEQDLRSEVERRDLSFTVAAQPSWYF
jgi:ssDNA thymidine ADP-ribosyltransferase, DarT